MQTLLHKAKIKDSRALGELYDMSYERIYRFIFYRTLDVVRTEDIVSDVWMKILDKIHTFHGNTQAEWDGWTLRIAYHTLVDTTRKTPPISLSEVEWEPISGDDITKTVSDRYQIEQVISYIERLSEREQYLLTLRIWDDLSYAEISAITGESISNCKQIVARALAKIQANIMHIFLFCTFLSYVGSR